MIRIFVMIFIFLFVAIPAWAEPTAKDLQVIARTLGFMEKPVTGSADLAIIFSADIPQSQQDAQTVTTVMGAGITVGGLTLKPRMVPIGQIDKAAGAAAIYATDGLTAQADQFAGYAKKSQIPCLTTALSYVTAHQCVIAIKTDPKVDITVSRSAAAATATTFAPAFHLMIHEVD